MTAFQVTTRVLPFYTEVLAAAGDTLVAFAFISPGTYRRSTDGGATWSSHTNPFGAVSISCIDWNGTYFLAIYENSFAKSTDGITWTTGTLPTASGVGSWTPMITWSGTKWLCTRGNHLGTVSTSTDGTTWTNSTVLANAQLFDCLWDGARFCVLAVNSAGTLNCFMTSAAGTSWTQTSTWSTNTANPTSILHNAGAYIAYGNTDLSASADGVTWTFPIVKRSFGARVLSGEIIYSESDFSTGIPRLLKGATGASLAEFSASGLSTPPPTMGDVRSYRGSSSKVYFTYNGDTGSNLYIVEVLAAPPSAFWTANIVTTEVFS